MRFMMLPTRPQLLCAALLCSLLFGGPFGCLPAGEAPAEDRLNADAYSELDSGLDSAPDSAPDSANNPPPFHPTDLDGLALLFDADSEASLEMTSQGLVYQWRDLSGGDNHAYQAIDRHMPVYRAGSQAGRTALEFDGSYLTTSEVLQLRSTGQGYTVFAVASNTVADDADGTEGRGGILLGNYRRPHSNFSVELHHARKLRHWWDRREEFGDPADENRGDAIFDTPRPDQDTFAILTFFLDASEHTVGAAVDGEFAESLPDDGFVYEVQRPLRIGADYREQNLPTAWNGSIGEILVYHRLLSESEMEEVHQYLSLKWEIPLVE